MPLHARFSLCWSRRSTEVAYRALEKLINLHDGYRRVFRAGQRELLLMQEGEERLLIDRHCPHAGQVLDGADCRGGAIQCPRHGFRFSLTDGAVIQGDCEPLRTYPLAFEGNSVGVDDSDLG